MSGLKYEKPPGEKEQPRLIPFGMSGLKFLTQRQAHFRALSHPVWDEWIEIMFRNERKLPYWRLIPFGMSGLKCRFCIDRSINRFKSHPVWDEWIEIESKFDREKLLEESHPVWDEWIEMDGIIDSVIGFIVSSRLG